MSIVSLFGIIVIPKLVDFLPTFNLEGESRKMTAKIRETQGLSIAKRKIYEITFSPAAEEYSISYIEGATTVPVETMELGGNVEIQNTTFPLESVAFNLFGAPTTGGDVILANPKGETVTVSITPATGRVSIQ